VAYVEDIAATAEPVNIDNDSSGSGSIPDEEDSEEEFIEDSG